MKSTKPPFRWMSVWFTRNVFVTRYVSDSAPILNWISGILFIHSRSQNGLRRSWGAQNRKNLSGSTGNFLTMSRKRSVAPVPGNCAHLGNMSMNSTPTAGATAEFRHAQAS